MPQYKVLVFRKDQKTLSDGEDSYEVNMIANDESMARESALSSFQAQFKDNPEECEFSVSEVANA